MNVDKGRRESPAGEVEFEYADLGEVAEKEEGEGSESQTETDQTSRREADTQTWAAGKVEFEYADFGEVAEKEEGEGSVNSEDVAESADQAPAEAVEPTENQERARARRIQQLTGELRNARQERNDLKFMLDQQKDS
ncbi:unnamed protein product [Nippostrongylus brasiliensis]|uniref:Histidine kinase n=1 Tax=Nippostrongylus brasiliensis TaxID=27835 RepID=A0A0N4YAR4_NIPBR|nr:unnamed protein product [Nippostrongylus brasiliensis]